ncbi:MAG: Choline-sulfatase [Candidatus Hydrogenedentes bacterium]|nr:Choline-sulfatase [Candidatus Hydrogenedentota bacterium]
MFARCDSRWLVLFLGCLLTAISMGAQAQQNVVIILLDAWREDSVDDSRNAVPLMPYLDNLPGIRFRQTESASPWTKPSVTSMLTSLPLNVHQMQDRPTTLPASFETAATYLKQAGYATYCVQTNSLLTVAKGYGQGFDQYDYMGDVPADQSTARALSNTASATEPYFLYLHLLDTHVPYLPPMSYRTLLGYPDPGLVPAEQTIVENFGPYLLDHLDYVLGVEPTLSYPPLSPVGEESARTLYDGEARFADEQIGLFIDALLARDPNTLIVILADHGEHFWEHNLLGHGASLYEPLTHIPLFITGAGITPGTVDAVVQTVDVLPTIANLLGLTPRPEWFGVDLLAPRDLDGPAFSSVKPVDSIYLDLEMVREGTMKLIWNRLTGGVELYDLAADPDEANNVAASQSAVAVQMMTTLNLHLLLEARANGADVAVSASPMGSVEAGSQVALTAGDGMAHQWYLDGAPLEDSAPRITGAKTRTLTIDPLETGDAGVYECVYSAPGKRLSITDPYTLNVLAAGSLPAAGLGALAVLMALFAALASVLLRKRITHP